MKYARKVTIIVVSIVNLIIVNVHKTIIPGSELSEYLVFEILGHTFGIPIGTSELTEHLLIKQYEQSDSLFNPIELINFFNI